MTTTTTTAAADTALLAELAAHRAHHGAAYRHHMDRARSSTGAKAVAWAIQARAIALAWKQDDQDSWASWYHGQDCAEQTALHARNLAAGPDGDAAQTEASDLVFGRSLSPADLREVEVALAQLAVEA